MISLSSAKTIVIIGLLGILSQFDALAGCKFFTTCGFSANSTVTSIVSADTSCITVDNIPATTTVTGCVTYRVCCQNIGFFSCSTNISINVAGPGGAENAVVPYKCSGLFCADSEDEDVFPTPEGDESDTCEEPLSAGTSSKMLLMPGEQLQWQTKLEIQTFLIEECS